MPAPIYLVRGLRMLPIAFRLPKQGIQFVEENRANHHPSKPLDDRVVAESQECHRGKTLNVLAQAGRADELV